MLDSRSSPSITAVRSNRFAPCTMQTSNCSSVNLAPRAVGHRRGITSLDPQSVFDIPNQTRMHINFGYVLLKECKKDHTDHAFSEPMHPNTSRACRQQRKPSPSREHRSSLRYTRILAYSGPSGPKWKLEMWAWKEGKFTGPSVAARSNIYAPSTARNKPQKAAPPPTYNVKLVLLMPMPGHGFTALELLNIDVDAAFEQIRDQFQVTITVLDDGDMIEIKAFNRKKANDAVRALRKILERKPGDRIVWRPLALIKPLSSGNDNGQIALIPNEGIEGARPFAIVKAGHSSESTDDKDGTQYKEELQKALARAVENLRYVPNRMRMRINFGHVLLKEWKKDQSEYTFAELKQMAHRAGPRGTVHMHTHIGHDNTVSRIKEQLRLIEDCVPQDIRINTTEDTPPSISLVLLTKNLVTESVIDFARGKSEIDSKERVTYKYVLGPMSVFHRERRARAVTIMTSCPEESFDWCLEVQSQVDSSKTPFPFQDKALRENVQFKDAAVTNRFPTININPYFLRANGVDVIIGKTSWTYLIKSRYVLEVGLYHQWHKDVKSKPSTGAVVSLYGCEWDYETEPADISKGPRDWTNFADNFLKSGSDDSDTFEDLTSLVSQVQAVLAEATKGDS